MDKMAPAPPRSSRPSSSASNPLTTVTMLRHPPYIIGASTETPPQKPQARPNEPHINSLPPSSKPRPSKTPRVLTPSQSHAAPLNGPAIGKSHDPSQHADPGQMAARLNEFADFLVQFNNTTVLAVDSRLQKMESVLGEHLSRSEVAYHDHEAQNALRLDSMSRSTREAVSDTIKHLFSEEEKRAREEFLAKSVSTAVLSALQPRFESINQQIEQSAVTTNTLQSCFRSLEERFKRLEDRVSVEFSKPLDRQHIGTSTLHTSPMSDGPAILSDQHLEEFGHMLGRLARLVEAARDEAHFDKEDIVKHFDVAQHGFALTLRNELQALKTAIGAGKGCLKPKEGASTLIQSSIAEQLESISLDVQELFECFQDSEAARDEEPSPLKKASEIIPNESRTSHVTRTACDAAVMTDDILPMTVQDPPKDPGKYTDAEVQACTSFETVDAAASTESLPSTPVTRSSSTMSIDGPAYESLSAATLVNGGAFVPPCFGGNLIPVSSWTMPFPHQWPAPESFPTPKLTLATDIRDIPETTSLASPALQLSGVPIDPSKSLISPPPSSVSRSPSVTLKRKADDVAEDAEISDDDQHRETSESPEVIKQQNDDDYSFDLNGSLSPLTPHNDELVIDLDRSPSPLTPLTSEAEDEGEDDGPESESEEPTAAEGLSSSTSGATVSSAPEIGTATEQEAASLLRYWCRDGCGRGYRNKDSLRRHARRGCPRENRSDHSSSASLAKRRKLTHDRVESSNSSSSSGSKKRGESRKSSSTITPHAHAPEVLEKCIWPAKTRVNETFDHQFLQCDRCDSSYHYRCIGVKKGDRRLVPEAAFICPPCAFVFSNDPNATVNKNDASACGRPDCDWPGEASNDNEDYFVVEKVLGRSVSSDSGEERNYLWLIKWSGYPIKECDWLEESALPNADGLISQFYATAAKEGMSLRDDNSIYLLHEARKVLHLAVKGRWKWKWT